MSFVQKFKLYTNSHGGACCGRNHVYEFGSPPTKEKVEGFQKLLNEKDMNLCWEITLTDHQLKRTLTKEELVKSGWGEEIAEDHMKKFDDRSWEEILEDSPFKLVHSFKNPNSRNIVHVFMTGQV